MNSGAEIHSQDCQIPIQGVLLPILRQVRRRLEKGEKDWKERREKKREVDEVKKRPGWFPDGSPFWDNEDFLRHLFHWPTGRGQRVLALMLCREAGPCSERARSTAALWTCQSQAGKLARLPVFRAWDPCEAADWRTEEGSIRQACLGGSVQGQQC